MNTIRQHFTQASEVLATFLADDNNFIAIEKAGELMSNAIKQGKKIISCGNGGSMCDAMHFAEELTGRYRDDRKALPAISIADPSHIACVGNDYGYEYIFCIGFRQDKEIFTGALVNALSAHFYLLLTLFT